MVADSLTTKGYLRRGIMKAKTIKLVVALLLGSILLSGILCVTVLRPLFISKVGSTTNLTITALNEKNPNSWDTEVRVSKIVIDGRQVDPHKISLTDNWALYDNYLLASYKNTAPSTLTIPLNNYHAVSLQFVEQQGSGLVSIQIGNYKDTLDLYKNANWDLYDWNYTNPGSYMIFSFSSCPQVILLLCMLIFSFSGSVVLLKQNKLKHIRLAAIGNAIIYCLLTFYTDSIAFQYSNNISSNSLKLYLWKILLLTILYVIFLNLFQFIKRIIERDFGARQFLKFFLPYFSILFGLLLITWPGIWRWDEFAILESIINLDVNLWQHYLTSVYYIMGFMMLPSPGGLIFLQITCISLIVAYIMKIFYTLCNKSKIIWLLMIPFLMLPVLDQSLYPLRLSLFSFIEVLYFCKLYILYTKKSLTINDLDIISITLMSSLLASWRSECVFFVILTPVVFCLLFWKRSKLKTKISVFVLSTIFSMVLIAPQSYVSKSWGGDEYQISPYIEFTDALIKKEYSINPHSDILATIDKVLNVQVFNSMSTGEQAFWNDGVRHGYTQEEWDACKKSILKLLIKYPDTYINERLHTFYITSGLIHDQSNQNYYNPLFVYSSNQKNFNDVQIRKYSFFRNYFWLTQPIDNKLRNDTISILECRNLDDYSKTNILYPICYNLILPFIILFLLLILGVIRRNICILFISGSVLLQFIMMFLIAPSIYFMYYFPEFLTAWVFAFGLFCIKLSGKKGKILKSAT